ncbi:MAG: hypothetical protein H7061_00545 [Bdellovibrionaceae bacterium]|nr:hypothetical protein [Bdellovibrio sp.]
MKTIKLLALLGLVSTLASCAHHRDVRPGEGGINRVIVKSEDPEDGSRNAIRQANHFCEKTYNKIPAFIEEDKKYTGDMKESDYKTAKTATKVAQGIGSAAWVLGGRRESTAGGIIGVGGSIARGALGEGYTVDMKFKCQ